MKFAQPARNINFDCSPRANIPINPRPVPRDRQTFQGGSLVPRTQNEEEQFIKADRTKDPKTPESVAIKIEDLQKVSNK